MRRTGCQTRVSTASSAWVLGALCLVLLTATAGAQDPPHWASAAIDIDCTSQCHVAHQAAGGNLTQAASNDNLCQSCHNPTGGALAVDLPINDADKADRTAGTGTSHAFEACSVDAALDTQQPLDNEMLLRLMGADVACPEGYVVCSTCHNQHRSESNKGGRSRIGNPKVVVAGGGSGVISPGGTFNGTEGVWYLVDITDQGSDTTARFRYSKDNGISWFPSGCTPSNLGPCLTASDDPASPVGLDSGVTVYFTGAAADDFRLGDQWEFSAAWPFLRAELDDLDGTGSGSFLCRDCHRAWDMDHVAVETYTGGPKSHPVGVTLNANNEDYDRTVPLDGNGADQGSVDADANPTNDLVFDANGEVQCLTCHGVHFTDTNTETVDVP